MAQLSTLSAPILSCGVCPALPYLPPPFFEQAFLWQIFNIQLARYSALCRKRLMATVRGRRKCQTVWEQRERSSEATPQGFSHKFVHTHTHTHTQAQFWYRHTFIFTALQLFLLDCWSCLSLSLSNSAALSFLDKEFKHHKKKKARSETVRLGTRTKFVAPQRTILFLFLCSLPAVPYPLPPNSS